MRNQMAIYAEDTFEIIKMTFPCTSIFTFFLFLKRKNCFLKVWKIVISIDLLPPSWFMDTFLKYSPHSF